MAADHRRRQVTGINVPLYYGPHLLGPIFAGPHASLVDTTVAGVEITSIMTAVNVASTYLGFRWIDKYGRRALSIGGYAGMAVFALLAALGLAFLAAIAFIYWFLPETKGLPVEEIITLFEKNRRAAR
ncbi:MAG TPA: MFS transporter [Trebonia sp.]